jgi:hypothetical protein
MSNYFQHFPKVDYNFGDEKTTSQFQHLGTYVDIIDQIKDLSVYYQTYVIQNGERPEQLSYKLYNNVNYYWTFYLLNDNLRQQGWPIRDADVFPKAQEYYPNTVLAVDGVSRGFELKLVDGEVVHYPTNTQTPLSKATEFRPGNYLWFKNSKTAGKILKVEQELGLIFTDVQNLRGLTIDRSAIAVSESEGLKVLANEDYVPQVQLGEMEYTKKYDEFDAPHHYEDVDKNWIYPTYSPTYPHPIDHSSVNTVNSVSYYERLIEVNDQSRVISVIKKDTIQTIAGELIRLLKGQ